MLTQSDFKKLEKILVTKKDLFIVSANILEQVSSSHKRSNDNIKALKKEINELRRDLALLLEKNKERIRTLEENLFT